MDHWEISAQDQTAIRDVKTGYKRLNYYWKFHYQLKERQYWKTTWYFWQAKWVHSHQVTPTHRNTEGRSQYTTEEVQRLDKTQFQWALSCNSLQMCRAGVLHPCRVKWQDRHLVWPVQLLWRSLWMTILRCNFNWTLIQRGIIQLQWDKIIHHTQPSNWHCSDWRGNIKQSELHATRVWQQPVM